MLTKNITKVIFVLLIGTLFFMTNPSHKTHKTNINNEYKKKNKWTGMLGGGRAIGAITTYNDYLFFSTTEFEDETVSIGFLTKVVIVKDLKVE